jgi:Spy/CpxP family protein refolding chaperone
MKKSYFTIVSIVIILSLLMSVGAFSAGDKEKPKKMMENCPMNSGKMDGKTGKMNDIMGNMMKMMMMKSFLLCLSNELKLTDQQIKKLEDLKLNTEKKMIDQHAEIMKAELDLQQISKDLDINIPLFEAKLKQISNSRIQQQISELTAFQQAVSILTPEQKARLETIWKMGMCMCMMKKCDKCQKMMIPGPPKPPMQMPPSKQNEPTPPPMNPAPQEQPPVQLNQ